MILMFIYVMSGGREKGEEERELQAGSAPSA